MAKAHETIADTLTGSQITALLSAGSNKVGAKCIVVKDSPLATKLMYLGLIGKNRGLTVKGSIVREILDERSYADLGL